jgi:hypothetical protein
MTFLSSQPKGVPAARLGQSRSTLGPAVTGTCVRDVIRGSGNGRCRCVLTNPTCPPYAQACHPRAGR